MGSLSPLNRNKQIIFTGNQSMAMYKFRMGIMMALIDLGFKVYVIAPPDEYSQKIAARGITFIPINIIPHQTNVFNDVRFFVQLLLIYRKISPDLIFHYSIKPNIYGTLAAALFKIPTFSIVPGRGHAFHKKNWLYIFAKQLYKFSQKYAKGVWFLNKEDRDFFIEQQMVSPEKTMILPGEGVNTFYYSPYHFKSKLYSDQTVFLLIGRLLWEKGVGDFVAAAQLVRKKHPNTKFQLLGFLDKNDSRVVPEKLVKEWIKNDLVDYLGEVQDVRPYLFNADCFVLPSFYGEGLPRSLMEAASMEIPLITTDHPGCRRTVKPNVNGYLCVPNNAQDLADKMMKFIELPTTKKMAMGKRGRQLMQQNFEEELIVDVYLKCIGEYLGMELSQEVVYEYG